MPEYLKELPPGFKLVEPVKYLKELPPGFVPVGDEHPQEQAPRQEPTPEAVEAGQPIPPKSWWEKKPEQGQFTPDPAIKLQSSKEVKEWMKSKNPLVSVPATVFNLLSGAGQVTKETVGLPSTADSLSKNTSWLDLGGMGKNRMVDLGNLMTFDDQEKKRMLKKWYPNAKTKTMPNGQIIVDIDGNVSLLNPAGLDSGDMQAIAANVAAYTPAARVTGAIAGTGAKVLGKKMAVGSLTSAATQALIEGGHVMMGGDFSGDDIAMSGLFGAGGELIAPAVGKIVAKAREWFPKKLSPENIIDDAGNPSELFKAELAKQGKTYDDFLRETEILNPQTNAIEQDIIQQLKGISATADPEQAARLALMKSVGVKDPKKYTLTQNPEQAGIDQQLLASSDQLADPAKAAYSAEAQQLNDSLDNLAMKLGDPDISVVGREIRGAIEEGEKLSLGRTANAYNKLSDMARGEGENIIVIPSKIKEVWQQQRIESGEVLKGPHNQLEQLMMEYKITPASAEFQKKVGDTVEMKDLTLASFEEFRKRLNVIQRADPNAYHMVGQIKNSVDEELDLMVQGFEGSTAANVSGLAKKARSLYKKHKDEFGSKIIDRILSKNTQGDYRIYEHDIFKNLIKGSKKSSTLFPLDQVLNVLRKTPKGKKAISNMQSRAVLEMLDGATKSKAKMAVDAPNFSEVQFQKTFDAMGKPEMKALFKDNPKGLQFLERFEKATKLADIPKDALAKGSAYQLQNLNIGTIGGGGSLLAGIGMGEGGMGLAMAAVLLGGDQLVKKQALKSRVQKAINSNPDAWVNYQEISKEFEDLFRHLGIAGLRATDQKTVRKAARKVKEYAAETAGEF